MTEHQHTLDAAAASTYIAAPLFVLEPALDTVLSDMALIEQICQHHELALGELYDRYSRLLYTIALRITGDRSSAEEVLQDVFTSIWQSAGDFRTDGSVKAWLLGITRHRAIDSMRVRNFRVHNNTVVLNELHCITPDDEIETQVIHLLEGEQVCQALSELSSLQRSTIELAYYAGCTCVEIADRMGVPLGTVKTRLRLGLSRLRALLSPEFSRI